MLLISYRLIPDSGRGRIRDAKKFGIRIRSRSESAKIALDRGRSKHPTKGKKRDSETKKKISESQGKVWDSLSAEERQKRSNIGKESWNKKTEQEKSDLIQKGSAAIRESARTGTKLERFLLEELTKRKYDVQFHREIPHVWLFGETFAGKKWSFLLEFFIL